MSSPLLCAMNSGIEPNQHYVKIAVVGKGGLVHEETGISLADPCHGMVIATLMGLESEAMDFCSVHKLIL